MNLFLSFEEAILLVFWQCNLTQAAVATQMVGILVFFHQFPRRLKTSMRIGIRPINDFAFKKIFGSDTNKLSLISFLNAVLCLGGPIVEVTIVNPYNMQDFLDDKLSILDIKATDANGAIYDIDSKG